MRLGAIADITEPLIRDLKPWFGQLLYAVSPDGNCFGYSWMLAALTWSAQDADRLRAFTRSLQAVYEAVEFWELDGQLQVNITEGSMVGHRTSHPPLRLYPDIVVI